MLAWIPKPRVRTCAPAAGPGCGTLACRLGHRRVHQAVITSFVAGTIDFESFELFWRSDERFAALQLNEEQEHFVVEVTAIFREVDSNASGFIDTQEEWLQLFGALCEKGYVNASSISGEQMWTALDKDQEGTVCFTEYLSWMVSSTYTCGGALAHNFVGAV